MDERLREYATDRQWEHLCAVEEFGTAVEAGKQLGINPSVFSRTKSAVLAKAAQHGYAPDYDLTTPTPPGYKIKGASTLIDKTSGEAKLQWIKTTVDAEAQEAAFQAFLDTEKDAIERVAPIKEPSSTSDHLLPSYFIGDHHLGMYAWGEETGGEDHDLARGEALLMGAMQHLVRMAPDGQQAAIMVLGDFFHYDSLKGVTPRHGHILDVSGRAAEMVRAGRRVIQFVIKCALEKHQLVHVLVEQGNHDEYSAIFLREMLAGIYENEPRLRVDTSPRNVHVLEFKNNLLATTHGDKIKVNDAALLLATDYPEMWGRTKYRYIHSCHDHHDRIKEVPGAIVEGHRILVPADWHSASHGHRSLQSMKSIVYHAEYGEVARHTVTPAMLDNNEQRDQE